jgi:hypothetical protein
VWATHAMEMEMAWICFKAHTYDEGAHCIWDMIWSHVTKVEKIKMRLGLMDRLQEWRASHRLWSDKLRGGEDWARLGADGPKQRWKASEVKINEPIWSCDDIKWIISLLIEVGVCVASTSEEMKWNAQGKGITYRIFYFTDHRCVEKFMTRFRIDSRIIKRGKLVCISII